MLTLTLLALLSVASPKAEVETWHAVPYSDGLKHRVTPPCKGTVEFGGFCWVPTTAKPPCSKTQVEYNGRCYLPLVKKPPRSPTSANKVR